MKRRFLLWSGFSLQPCRLVQLLAALQPAAATRTVQQRAAARVVRLEEQLGKHGAGLGV